MVNKFRSCRLVFTSSSSSTSCRLKVMVRAGGVNSGVVVVRNGGWARDPFGRGLDVDNR